MKCTDSFPLLVCVQVLDGDGSPLQWEPHGNFWQITYPHGFRKPNLVEYITEQIRRVAGNSYCVTLWQTARLIDTVGCDNVHVWCDATETEWVMEQGEWE